MQPLVQYAQPYPQRASLDDLLAQWKLANELLAQIKAIGIQKPRRSDSEAVQQFLVRGVEVVTAGQVYRGPDLPIPEGWTVTIRQRNHAGSPVGYVGGSSGDVGNPLTRVEMGDGDTIETTVSNLKNLYFGSDTNATFFEMIVEL